MSVQFSYVALYAPFITAVCDVTGARWRFHANRNSFHGVVPPKPVGSRWLTLWSLDECLDVCSSDLRCQAADFDMDTRTCYVHHAANFVDTRGPYPHVHQFVVAQRCRPGRLRAFSWINYLRQGGYVFARLCLSVCLSVCQQDNSKSYGRIFLKFCGNVENGKKLPVIQFWG